MAQHSTFYGGFNYFIENTIILTIEYFRITYTSSMRENIFFKTSL